MNAAVQAGSFGLVAGEASGDKLGAALIEAIRGRARRARGSTASPGRRMGAAGCEAWHESDELAVMGLVEVLHHLPRLLRLRRALVAPAACELRPDVFVGIDAPEFNLGLAKALKRQGCRTVQYVSPQVWAWRQGRVTHHRQAQWTWCCACCRSRRSSTAAHGVRAEFVGHPLADQHSAAKRPRCRARARSDSATGGAVVAVLPGSRRAKSDASARDSPQPSPGSHRVGPT